MTVNLMQRLVKRQQELQKDISACMQRRDELRNEETKLTHESAHSANKLNNLRNAAATQCM
jgi:uncharacterized coiled-coil DUF342 family protein